MDNPMENGKWTMENMRSLFITTISIYQKFFSPILHQLLGVQKMCRYEVSCSEYAKQSIAEYGILRGGVMALKRLLSCQPFSPIDSSQLTVHKAKKS